MIGSFLFRRPKEYYRKAVDFIRNPTSIYVAILFATQAGLLIFLSVLIPVSIRYLILPSSIQREVPINLVFSPCSQELHGICSFPTAYLDVSELELFSPSVNYQIAVKLYFSDAESNFGIGLFQNELSLKDSDDKLIGHWRRSALLKQPGFFTKTMWLCFFPLYFLGFFHNYSVLEIPLVPGYFASHERPAVMLTYSLQDRFAQVDSATLLVNAKFGLIRHFVYYWPILSFGLMFISVFLAGGCLLAIFWGHKSYVTYRRATESEIDTKSEVSATSPTDPSPKGAGGDFVKEKKSKKKTRPVADDEFIPDNVDEIPECPDLTGVPIPGWNISFRGANGSPSLLRKRK